MAESAAALSESKVVREHYYSLVFAFSEVLGTLAARLLLKGLVDEDILARAVDSSSQSEDERAEALLEAILSRLESAAADKEERERWFEVLVAEMHQVPELSPHASKLETALRAKEDSYTRSVFVIQPPPLLRNLSLQERVASGGDLHSSEADSGISSTDDTTSLFEFELPDFLTENEMELIVDPKPVAVSAAEACAAGPTPQQHPLTPEETHSADDMKFTYTIWSTPLDAEGSGSDKEGSRQGSIDGETDSKERELSGERLASELTKVKQLKVQPGIIASKKDKKIVSLTKKYERTNKQIEDAIKSKAEIKKKLKERHPQAEDPKPDSSAAEPVGGEVGGRAESNEHPSSLETQLSDLEVSLKASQKRVEDNLEGFQTQLQDIRKELQDTLLKKKEEVSKTKVFLEQKSVKKVAEERPLGAGGAILKPSLADALDALLPVAYHWKTIGVLLGLQYSLLNSIERETAKDQGAMREMTALWVRTRLATWDQLVYAVRRVGEQVVAAEIEKKYIHQQK